MESSKFNQSLIFGYPNLNFLGINGSPWKQGVELICMDLDEKENLFLG
jgi:hypothetical protein